MTYDVRGKGIKNEHNEIIDYVVVQDHSYGHTYTNGVGNQPSHFNVRPITNTQNGKVSGMKGHYYFGSITKLMGFRIPHIINSAHINEF